MVLTFGSNVVEYHDDLGSPMVLWCTYDNGTDSTYGMEVVSSTPYSVICPPLIRYSTPTRYAVVSRITDHIVYYNTSSSLPHTLIIVQDQGKFRCQVGESGWGKRVS